MPSHSILTTKERDKRKDQRVTNRDYLEVICLDNTLPSYLPEIMISQFQTAFIMMWRNEELLADKNPALFVK